jgi:RNA polymerase sigma-70 factor (ECF subfamily)
MELLHKDNREGFIVLYRTYWADMYKAAFNVLKDRDQSMDTVQEIFVWLWEHHGQLVITTSLKGYLLAAVKFKTANIIRNGKIRKSIFKEITTLQPSPDDNSFGAELEAKELEELIRQIVEAFPDKCRTVYQLSRNQNLSNREIANALGISIKTVENQMTIALRRLRSAVTRLFMCIL